MSEHIVTAFDSDLNDLAVRIVEMGGMAEHLVVDAMQALRRRDGELAARVIAADERVDEIEHEVEERAILLIARRQPVALDLREVVAAIKISSDLERIADLAKNIAKRVVVLQNETQPQKIVLGLDHINDLALMQLKNVLDAYTERDGEKALEVWRRDRDIDAMYTSIFRELLTYMMEDPRSITQCTHLLFAAKNIERIGDHATNIAETVHYLVTGHALREPRPKKDHSAATAHPAADAGA